MQYVQMIDSVPGTAAQGEAGRSRTAPGGSDPGAFMAAFSTVPGSAAPTGPVAGSGPGPVLSVLGTQTAAAAPAWGLVPGVETGLGSDPFGPLPVEMGAAPPVRAASAPEVADPDPAAPADGAAMPGGAPAEGMPGLATIPSASAPAPATATGAAPSIALPGAASARAPSPSVTPASPASPERPATAAGDAAAQTEADAARPAAQPAALSAARPESQAPTALLAIASQAAPGPSDRRLGEAPPPVAPGADAAAGPAPSPGAPGPAAAVPPGATPAPSPWPDLPDGSGAPRTAESGAPPASAPPATGPAAAGPGPVLGAGPSAVSAVQAPAGDAAAGFASADAPLTDPERVADGARPPNGRRADPAGAAPSAIAGDGPAGPEASRAPTVSVEAVPGDSPLRGDLPGQDRIPQEPPRPLHPAHPLAEAPRQAVRSMAEALHRSADGAVELTLSPEELGRVRLTLTPGDGAITVTISAERGDTLDLMRRHADMLNSALRELGYGEVVLDFAGQGARRGHAPSAEGGTGEADPADALAQADAPRSAASARHGAGGGLDLRL